MRSLWIIVTVCNLAMLTFIGCFSTPACYAPLGNWTTGDGQELVFMDGGKGLWITSFGRMGDTVAFEYKNDCNADVPVLDLLNLRAGPHTGKSLYGIIDWQSDSAFRWRYESGMQSNVRPTGFDLDHTMKFIKKK